MVDGLDSQALNILREARTVARRLGQSRLGTEAILLALLRSPQEVWAGLLGDLGIEASEVLRRLEAALRREGTQGRASPGEPVQLSREAQKVVNLAVAEARKSGDPLAGPDQLLLSLLRCPDCRAAGVLRSLGLEPEEVGHGLLQELRNESCVSGESLEALLWISRAREGDASAKRSLCSWYRAAWLPRLQGRTEERIARSAEARPPILDAVSEALQDVRQLSAPSTFFAWVTLILRRRMLARGPRGREGGPGVSSAHPEAEESGRPEASPAERDYYRILDAIRDLFPSHPEAMAVVYLSYFEKKSPSQLESLLSMSGGALRRLLHSGLDLLRTKLGTPVGGSSRACRL